MPDKIRAVIYGVGVIGAHVVYPILEKKGIEMVGAVDVAKDKTGRDLGEVIGEILESRGYAGIRKEKIGVNITDDINGLFSKVDADIAMLTTFSYVKQVHPQIMQCVKAGMNVISSCEELSYPWLNEPQLSSEIDGLAKQYGVTVLGTGVNPGYGLDTLPIALTGACRSVKKIEATRAVAIAKRRAALQRKLGVGMSPEEFKQKIANGEITGHVGTRESVAMIAEAIGWTLDEIKETPPSPIIAKEPVQNTFKPVMPGQMLGYASIGEGVIDGKTVIKLNIRGDAGLKEGYMEYNIEGAPSFTVKVGEILGDWETAHVMINMIPKVITARPGLLTMKDLPLISAVLGDMRTFV
ncbi:MAG: hypothetical protein JSV05_04675 [Candidatus Bathyarchaeota archaeon]|nr:MAG: hypothetical protein JSV05_04675 [Candidatus Bathyarchaeota archaeon]